MDTWRLVDAGVFFTFFVRPLFLRFWGPCEIFFAELPHCVNHSVRTNFFDLVRGFFFEIFSGGLGNSSLLTTFLLARQWTLPTSTFGGDER